MPKPYTTYLYTSEPKGGHLGLPGINGEVCVAFSAADLFQEQGDALTLIAKIRGGYLKNPEEAARKFLDARGYEHTWPTLISR